MRKRITALMLSLLLMLSLSFCTKQGGKEANVTEAPPVPESTEPWDEPQAQATAEDVELFAESCSFKEKIEVFDREMSGLNIPQKEGKIYVDTVFYISYNRVELTENDFEGNVSYNGVDYPVNFCYELVGEHGIEAYSSYPAQRVGRIHIFAVLPLEALGSEDTVATTYAFGERYMLKVSNEASDDDMYGKIPLVKGKTEVAYNQVSVTVVDAFTSERITATGENAIVYLSDAPIHDLIIDITNNTDARMEALDSYSFNTQGAIVGHIREEINNNTDLADFSGLAPGEKKRIHIQYNTHDTDGIIRLNIEGCCYYYSISDNNKAQ